MIDTLRADLSCFSHPIQHKEGNDTHEQDQSWRRPASRARTGNKLRPFSSYDPLYVARIRSRLAPISAPLHLASGNLGADVESNSHAEAGKAGLHGGFKRGGVLGLGQFFLKGG